MKRLENMKETLMNCVMAQMADLKNVDTKELGEAVDMIKDLSEAMYYCTITEAMNSKEEHPQRETHYYTERIKEPYWMEKDPYYKRDSDRHYGRMYYDGNGGGGNGLSGGATSSNGSSSNGNDGGSRSYYQEREYPMTDIRDPREGRSYMSRRMYMESKEMGKDKLGAIQDLDHYMMELSEDITEMIENSSLEEKQLLQKKLTMLAQKIVG